MMSRSALNDLSHQKNLHSQQAAMAQQHKLCQSARQMSKSNQYLQANNSQPNGNNLLNTSSKTSQYMHPFTNQGNGSSNILPGGTSNQLLISISPASDSKENSNNSNSSNNSNFFTQPKYNNSSAPNMFSQQFGKENQVQGSQFSSQSSGIPLSDPPESKFGGSYHIFESMIGEGIKDFERMLQSSDLRDRKEQRKQAFSSMIDIKLLESIIDQDFTVGGYDQNMDRSRNENLLLPSQSEIFDEESAIKKSLSALNEDYAALQEFNMPTFEEDIFASDSSEMNQQYTTYLQY